MKIQAGTSQSNTTHRAGIILSEDQDDQFIMEYDGRGSDSGNFLTFYSAISGWVGHGQGFCYVPANGRCGIGTSSPLAKLHVNGTNSAFLNTTPNSANYLGEGVQMAWYYTSPGVYMSNLGYGGTSYDLSILASGSIATNGIFFSAEGAWSSSDARVKQNIKEVNDDDALLKLRQIQPKTYGYKDVGKRGEEEVLGFIADEVEEVLPEAVKKTISTIPNILEMANVANSNIITFTNFNTSNLSNAFTLECVDVRSGDEQYITVIKVIDDKTIQVKEDLSNWTGSFDETGNLVVETTTTTLTLEEYEALYPEASITGMDDVKQTKEQNGYIKKGDVYEKTTTSYPGNNLFIRGERVNDFRALKKEMLFAINFSATQELDKQLQAEKAKVASLEARILALENK